MWTDAKFLALLELCEWYANARIAASGIAGEVPKPAQKGVIEMLIAKAQLVVCNELTAARMEALVDKATS